MHGRGARIDPKPRPRPTAGLLPRLLALLLALLSLSASPVRGEEVGLPGPLTKRIARLSRQLARRGLAAELDVVLETWRRLGGSPDQVDTLRKRVARDLSRARPAPRPAKGEAKAVAKLAADLATLLPEREGTARTALAHAILRLDDSVPQAHAAVGHIQHDGRWVEARTPGIEARRRARQEALRKAHGLEIPMQINRATHPLLTALGYGEVAHVRSGKVQLFSPNLPVEKLARIGREGLRARALSEWLHTGRLEVPDLGLTALVLGSREDYLKAVDASAAAKALGGYDPAWTREAGHYGDTRGWVVLKGMHGEAYDESWLLADLYYDDRGQPALDAGHLNWICLAFLGTRFPVVAWIEAKEEAAPESGTVSPDAKREREAMMRVSTAGFSGARAWITWLAKRGEDPPFTACMKDEIGKIQGTPLFKATFVAEYLYDLGTFPSLWKATLPAGPATDNAVRTFGKALGTSMEAFEASWRAWLLPPEPGLVERLSSTPAAGLTDAEKKLLAHLDAARKAAQGEMHIYTFEPVGLDASLSRGCALHARYLDGNRDQLSRWPDAHEEYPDRRGFTAAGNWAGQHSVIAPGTRDPTGALDAWLGTYFHRLPLLRLGLVRVGWAQKNGIAVLDAGSMSGAPCPQACVCWPAPGATDVPRRFVPEIPNPFPGEDQSRWGYAVTLQVDAFGPMPRVEVALFEGPPSDAARVDCRLTSPDNPGNPDLVPDGAYGLIPISPLKTRTLYTVVVRGLPDKAAMSWTFRTGS